MLLRVVMIGKAVVATVVLSQPKQVVSAISQEVRVSMWMLSLESLVHKQTQSSDECKYVTATL